MNATGHARPGAAPGAETARVEPASEVVSSSLAAGLPSFVPARPPVSKSTPIAVSRPFHPGPRSLDDLDFLDGDPSAALHLGALPAGHIEAETLAGTKLPTTVRFTPQPMEAVKASATATPGAFSERADPREPSSAASQEPSSGRRNLDAAALSSQPIIVGLPSIDPRPGIVAFAGFGFVPEKLSEMPAYALRVFARRRVLRAGLAVARAHRPRDVELYQAALVAADEGAVRKGLLLLAALVIATLGVIAAAFELVA